jgi:hypothetical protein
MQIDLEHLHFWMQAIRQSSDPIRTMDAFWSGQLKSKEWLIENLIPYVDKPSSVEIHGGWVGVLASMLFQSKIECKNIISIDVDPDCESIATMMNKKEEMLGMFRALTADMCDYKSESDIVINTSCEHIVQSEYDTWLSRISKNSLLVLQSNNYNIPEHVRTADSIDEFVSQCGDLEILCSKELKLPLYSRWMIVGKKNA